MAVRSAARRFAHAAGVPALLRSIHRDEFRILTYHRFADLPGLERQCDHLRKCYRPMSFDQLRAGDIPPNGVAVTIDDGFHDVAAAAPIFEHYGIPVMLYLVSGFLDGELWMWWNRIQYAFREAKAQRVNIAGRSLSEHEVIEHAKLLPNEERLGMVEEIARVFGVALPSAPPPEFRPLTWDQVRALPRNFSFGAHTRTHPILSRLSTREDIAAELSQSKTRIETELRVRVPDFSYPNGQPPDIPADSETLLREVGFETAVTTIRGRNRRNANRLHLNRLSVEPYLPADYFAEILSGMRLS